MMSDCLRSITWSRNNIRCCVSWNEPQHNAMPARRVLCLSGKATGRGHYGAIDLHRTLKRQGLTDGFGTHSTGNRLTLNNKTTVSNRVSDDQIGSMITDVGLTLYLPPLACYKGQHTFLEILYANLGDRFIVDFNDRKTSCPWPIEHKSCFNLRLANAQPFGLCSRMVALRRLLRKTVHCPVTIPWLRRIPRLKRRDWRPSVDSLGSSILACSVPRRRCANIPLPGPQPPLAGRPQP